jgi:hypothetical protein
MARPNELNGPRAIAAGLALAMAALVAAPAAAQQPAEARQVELFKAMSDGDIEVKFIAQSDRAASVLITNKTKQPLTIQLPDVFAGVPADVAAQNLAQPGVGGVGLGGGGQNINNSNQGLGGGFGGGFGGGLGGLGGGGLGGFGGGGGGLFNVAPEKVGRIEVNCVCLDHGKNDPKPTMDYVLIPVDKYVDKPEVVELLRAYRTGQLNHAAAQAAAWHMNNGLSWEQLAVEAVSHIGRPDTPYFSPIELQAGARFALAARQQAELVKRQVEAESRATSLAQ